MSSLLYKKLDKVWIVVFK